MRTIIWAPSADRDLERLSADVATRVTAAIERFATTGQGDVTRLTAAGDELRLRVGDWPVRFTLEPGIIVANRILPWGRAYRG